MSSTIEEFRQEHERIGAALEEVRRLGIGTAEGRQALFAARKLLVDHLERENSLLYPALSRQAEGDPALQALIADFTSEMDKVALQASSFFDKYSASSGGLDFAREFGRLLADLNRRIRREERSLYPEFERRAK